VFIYICLLEWFMFSRSIEFMYLMNCFRYLLVSSLLLTGQLPTLSTLVFRVSLSFFSLLHWNIRWSTVCVHTIKYESYEFLFLAVPCMQHMVWLLCKFCFSSAIIHCSVNTKRQIHSIYYHSKKFIIIPLLREYFMCVSCVHALRLSLPCIIIISSI
jgi:hypothetical protein